MNYTQHIVLNYIINVTGAKITLQNAISHFTHDTVLNNNHNIRDYVPANYFIMYKFRVLIRFTLHFILIHVI